LKARALLAILETQVIQEILVAQDLEAVAVEREPIVSEELPLQVALSMFLIIS
jgi:hypothetical protein